MVWIRYTLQQRLFLYDCYVKRSSVRVCRRKFCRKFPGERIPSRTAVHKLINKVRVTGSLLDKKTGSPKLYVLTEEKLDEIGALIENSPGMSVNRVAQQCGIARATAAKAMKLLRIPEVQTPGNKMLKHSARMYRTQNKKKQNPTKKRRVAAESDTSSEVSKMHVFDDMTIRTESIDETHAEGENCVLGDLA
ncbi:uncharacterized protein [Periplaneta americana]|uniref:uncharacterized protein isoform X1 n=1 Tax=Periplaneta americana TaxID=6978 RepID=UPI0037E6F814